MAEYRFADTDYFATEEFHAEREAADHLHDAGHRERMHVAAGMVNRLVVDHNLTTVTDYGCGNGGLLSLVRAPRIVGYDFCPANVEAAKELGRPVEHLDFTTAPLQEADVAVMSEVLEHMNDPHGFLKRLQCHHLVASVPHGETDEDHYEYHLWGWDAGGFAAMLVGAGFTTNDCIIAGQTQVWSASR